MSIGSVFLHPWQICVVIIRCIIITFTIPVPPLLSLPFLSVVQFRPARLAYRSAFFSVIFLGAVKLF